MMSHRIYLISSSSQLASAKTLTSVDIRKLVNKVLVKSGLPADSCSSCEHEFRPYEGASEIASLCVINAPNENVSVEVIENILTAEITVGLRVRAQRAGVRAGHWQQKEADSSSATHHPPAACTRKGGGGANSLGPPPRIVESLSEYSKEVVVTIVKHPANAIALSYQTGAVLKRINALLKSHQMPETHYAVSCIADLKASIGSSTRVLFASTEIRDIASGVLTSDEDVISLFPDVEVKVSVGVPPVVVRASEITRDSQAPSDVRQPSAVNFSGVSSSGGGYSNSNSNSADVAKLENELKAARDAEASLAKQVKDLEENLGRLSKEAGELDLANQNYLQKILLLESRDDGSNALRLVSELQIKNDELMRGMASISKKESDCCQQLAELAAKSEKESTRLIGESARLGDDLNRFKKDNQGLNEKLLANSQYIGQLNEQALQQQQEYVNLKADFDSKVQVITSLERELAVLREEHARDKVGVSNLLEKNVTLSQEKDAINQEKVDLARGLDSAIQDNISLAQVNLSLLEEKASLVRDNTALIAELADLKEQFKRNEIKEWLVIDAEEDESPDSN